MPKTKFACLFLRVAVRQECLNFSDPKEVKDQRLKRAINQQMKIKTITFEERMS